MTINGKALKHDQDLVELFFKLCRIKNNMVAQGEDITEIQTEIFNVVYYLNFIA